jgi:hypothetical protein
MAHPRLGPSPLSALWVQFPWWAVVHGNFLWHLVGSLAATTADRYVCGIVEGSGGLRVLGVAKHAKLFFFPLFTPDIPNSLSALLSPLPLAQHHRSTVAAQVMRHHKSHVPPFGKASYLNLPSLSFPKYTHHSRSIIFRNQFALSLSFPVATLRIN